MIATSSQGGRIYKESVELTFVYLSEGCGKTLIIDRRHKTPHSDRYGVRVRRTRPATGIYTKVSVVPFRPYDQENFHIFRKGLAKNTFTICNVRRQKPPDSTNLRKSFYKQTTLTGGIAKMN